MTKKLKTIFTTLLLICGILSIASAQEKIPQRIISLVPSITTSLFDLGVGDKIVGNTTYCKYPIEARSIAKVGTAISVNVEHAFTLKPDIIFASTLIRPEEKQKLMDLGVKVMTFTYPRSFEEINEQFLEIGKLVGKEEIAKQIITEAEKDVASIKAKYLHTKKPRIFVQIGAKPLVTVTKVSFINDFITFSGAINITEDLKNIKYSREQVLLDNPDIIITITMGVNGDGEKSIWERFPSINAVKNKRIYVMDADFFCSPTPIIFAQTLEKVALNINEKTNE